MQVAGIDFTLLDDMWFGCRDLGPESAWKLNVAAMASEPGVFEAEFEHKETGETTTVLGDLGSLDAAGLKRLAQIGQRLDHDGQIGAVYQRRL